jgi:acetoin utilization protein AcuB
MRVLDLIRGQKVVVASAEDDLALALRLMLAAGGRHLPIVDGRTVVGVVTERDVLRRHAEVGSQVASAEKVRKVMTQPPVVAWAHDDLETARRIMLDRGVGCLPVLGSRDEIVGIVTRSDLLRTDIGPDRGPAPRPETAGMLMRRAPLTASADDHLFDALARMELRGIRHLPVVDGEHRVIGMLSDRDVRTAVGNHRNGAPRGSLGERLRALRVSDVMSREPFVLQVDAPVAEVVKVFVDQKIGAVPIVGGELRLVGIISYVDVLKNADAL